MNINRLLPTLLVPLAIAAAPAHAASATYGQHYQSSSNITSSSPPVASACNALTYCYIVFPKVATGKRLIVRQVSCQLSVSTGEPVSIYLGVRLSNGEAAERFQFLRPSILPSNTPGSTVVVNENAYQPYNQGQRPEIYLGLTQAANTTGFCTVAGELQDVPLP
jgi:hypothetical protein